MLSTFERKDDKATGVTPIAEHLAVLNGAERDALLAQFLI